MPQPPKLIGAVERALDILGLFAPRTPELGITEIAAATGLHKSTAAGLIRTLTVRGYLSQNPATRKYRLGLELVDRAMIVLGSMDLRQAALPSLHQLRDRFDETVNLAILDAGYMVYVERLLGTQALGMRSEVGKREPANSTALGKAIYACLPEDDLRLYVARHGLHPVTERTISNFDALQEHLARVRQQGYAVDDEENQPGARCVAAAIFDHTGKPVGAISISAPTTRLTLPDLPRFGAAVRAAAEAISISLGFSAK